MYGDKLSNPFLKPSPFIPSMPSSYSYPQTSSYDYVAPKSPFKNREEFGSYDTPSNNNPYSKSINYGYGCEARTSQVSNNQYAGNYNYRSTNEIPYSSSRSYSPNFYENKLP